MIDKSIYEKSIKIESKKLMDEVSKFSQGRKCEVILVPAVVEYYEGESKIEYLTNGEFLKTYNTLLSLKNK
ncbi:hypothetical protein [Clostridium botulinum]|uniref:hypothetical protein n=1 Tax=Clostridium botulinum TaxID=1491 RepID=UPI0004BA3CB6|nr:hypothetical protein [Clostridium botulinum]QDY27136.1 hypothetical protein CGQ40_20745 [Clostridium botulinum]